MSKGPMNVRIEPFRVFFPLGYILAILGLGVWLLDIMDPSRTYPGRGHAVLMMQGFAFSFCLGIILTELRKSFGGTEPPRLISIVLFPVLLLGMGAAALAQAIALSQIFFFLASLAFSIYLALSFFLRKGPAHPDFTFTAGAALSITAGSLAWLLGEAGHFPPEALRWGQLACFQVFFLLFAFGTFHWEAAAPETPSGSGNGGRIAANFLVILLLLGAIAVEAFAPAGPPGREFLVLRLVYAFKAAVVAWFLWSRVKPSAPAFLGSARLALFFVMFGLSLPILFPDQAVAVSHVTYVAGFCWLVLARATALIAIRHSFQMPLGKWGTVILYGSLLAVGGVLRVIADFAGGGRGVLLFLAALFVLMPILLWSFLFFPYIGDARKDARG